MKIIDEAYLRAACLPATLQEYVLPQGSTLTPLAMEYLAKRNIAVVQQSKTQAATMPIKPKKRMYIDAATGQSLAVKPENMTHLRDNLLVPKTHPRIALRGKLDSLEAKIIEIQAEIGNQNKLYGNLDEALCYVRQVLAAEVNDKELPPIGLLGYDSEQLRKVSHNISEQFGFDHPVPSAAMGVVAARLNALRTQVRECELAAVRAFGNQRADIIQALNRLSSGVYIMFCSNLAGRYN